MSVKKLNIISCNKCADDIGISKRRITTPVTCTKCLLINWSTQTHEQLQVKEQQDE